MNTSNNLLRDSIAALRGLGTSITRVAHELHRNIRCRFLAYLLGMSRHSVPCALPSNRSLRFLEVFI